MDDPDWNQLRAFVATAEAGTLSAAARKLGLTQPTLSRQVAALEESLGVTLFERLGKSLVLTDTGTDLLEHARLMKEAAEMLALGASGRAQEIEGVVSISASDGMATYILPDIVSRIRAEEPRLVIEIVASNALSGLKRREADIAIRHVRPAQPDLVGKLVREATASFYASRKWVAQHGHPANAAEVEDAEFIGFDSAGRTLEYLRSLGLNLSPRNFHVICENSSVTWEMIKRGVGIGVMGDDIAASEECVVRILENVPLIRFPIWLVTHRESRTSRRIRLVFDILARELAANRAPRAVTAD